MKKTLQFFIINLLILGGFSACTSMQQTGSNSNAILSTVQGVLNNGTSQAFNLFEDSNAFMTNALIEAALPKELKDINTKLESLGLSHIVNKEKQYISQIANSSITTASPIVKKAINQMTLSDAINIVSGGNGAATNYLKTKTETQLRAAIMPVVRAQTENLGINSLLSNALGTNSSILGVLMGTGTTQSTSELLNDAITQQLVEGLFNVVEDVENDTRANPGTLLNSVLGTTTK